MLLCPTLCDPMGCSPPGSSIHGIFQASILECIAISFSRDLPDPEIEPASPALAGRFFTTSTTWEALEPSYFRFVVNWINFLSFHFSDLCPFAVGIQPRLDNVVPHLTINFRLILGS